MDLPRNSFKQALKDRHRQIGLWCSINDTAVAELVAGLGYDWLLFDGEHAALDPLRILPLLQAVAPYPSHPIVRPASLDPAEIKRLLDFGVQSLLIPYVRSAEEARLAASAVAYGPDGVRGFAGLTRATRFGRVTDYARRAREEICLIVQVETAGALAELEDIATVPGVDAVFIGPADLAASMGYPGEPSHPEVRAACLDAIGRLKAVGTPSGFLSLDPPVQREVAEAGADFFAVDVDIAILQRGAAETLRGWR